jgi:hypothetical protein
MCSTGWLKRALPFLATFAVGIYIASFFVSIGPRFAAYEHRRCRFEQMQRLRMENDDLREENLRLKSRPDMNWDNTAGPDGEELQGPDWKVSSPPPPPRPIRLHR